MAPQRGRRRQLLIQAALPVLLVQGSATLASGGGGVNGSINDEDDEQHHPDGGDDDAKEWLQQMMRLCINDQPAGNTNTGCPVEAPICITVKNQKQPPLGTTGDACVPCLNYYQLPGESDFGCTDAAPLCVVETNGPEGAGHERPTFGMAGTTCVPYPCHHTASGHDNHNNDHVVLVDQGCTAAQPVCVDGLGQAPPMHQPGVQCVTTLEKIFSDSVFEELETSSSPLVVGRGLRETFGWISHHQEKDSTPRRRGRKAVWGQATSKRHGATTVHCADTVHAGQFSFCHGCPFGRGGAGTHCGISRSQLSW